MATIPLIDERLRRSGVTADAGAAEQGGYFVFEAHARPSVTGFRQDAEHRSEALAGATAAVKSEELADAEGATLREVHGAVEGRDEAAHGSVDAALENFAAGGRVVEQVVAAERRQEAVEHGMGGDFVAFVMDAADLLGAVLGRRAVERNASHYAEGGHSAAFFEDAEEQVGALLVGVGGPALHAERIAVALGGVVVERNRESHGRGGFALNAESRRTQRKGGEDSLRRQWVQFMTDGGFLPLWRWAPRRRERRRRTGRRPNAAARAISGGRRTSRVFWLWLGRRRRDGRLMRGR